MNAVVVLISTCAAILLLIGTQAVGAQTSPAEEFVGPFPSWRQVQCGGVDDTALLQGHLDTLGRSGSPVLYISTGTCRITSMLKLGQGAAGNPGGVDKITIMGHDPADTIIKWAGPAGGKMLEINGVARSRFGRLTWDGNGTADIGWIDRTASGQNYFPTGNRLEDMIFRNIRGVALYLGAESTGTSEWEYMRVQFVGPGQAAVMLANQNTLDHWFWDSSFSNYLWAITNYIPERKANGGGGDYAVNRSNFLNNGWDLTEGNVQVFMSSRWNYSRGSKGHINWVGVGRNNSSITVQGLTAIDFTANTPISEADAGPLAVLDSTFRGGKPTGMIGVHEAYCSTDCLGDLWAIGNTFSNTSASQYAIPWPNSGRIHAGLDDRLGQTIVDPGPIVLPSTPPATTRPVFEVTSGNIAAALAQAGTQPAVVHIPYGRYDVLSTLNVGPNVILTGDGVGATTLAAGPNANPILKLTGPSHATVRDLSLLGWRANGRITTGLLADNADQPGGLVHAEMAMLQADKRAWDLTGLTQTKVDLFDDYNGANTHCGSDGTGPDVDYHVDGSTLSIFNGAGAGSDAKIRMLNNANVVGQTVYFEGNPGCQRTAMVTPNSSGNLTINEGNFAPNRGDIDLRTFGGQVTVTNFASTMSGGSRDILNRNVGPNSLVLGLPWGGTNDHTVTPTCETPCLLWLPQVVAPNNATPEQNKDVANPNQFMRDHLAPLRAAKPLAITGRAADVTEIKLIRVNVEQMNSGIKITGSTASPPTATPTALPTNTATASPTATATSTPTALPTNTATASPTATSTSTPLPTQTPTAQPTQTPTTAPTASPTSTAVPVPTQTPTAVPAALRARWNGHGDVASHVHNQLTSAPVSFTNTGTAAWPASGPNPVRITSWWIKDGKPVAFGDRWSLPFNVAPGQSVTNYQLYVVTPPAPGQYVLHIALTQEPSTWFGAFLEFPVTIT